MGYHILPAVISFNVPFSCISSNIIYCQKDFNAEETLKFYRNEIELINLKSGDTLVDIGAGYGYVNALYASLVPNIFQVLLDTDKKVLSRSNLKQAYKEIRKSTHSAFNFNYDFKISLKDSIPLDPSSCNKILCRRSLHEFTEPSKMLKEIRRVLKDSGEVGIIEAQPKRKGIRDDYCGLPYLMPDEIIKMFTDHKFILKNQQKEEMNLIGKGTFSVLTFTK
mgnify:CR=1 FL=1